MPNIQLRNGKQQLSLPPWMTFHHLPEYGISSSSPSSSHPIISSSTTVPTTTTTNTSNDTTASSLFTGGNGNGDEVHGKTRKRRGIKRKSSRLSSIDEHNVALSAETMTNTTNTTNNNTYAAKQTPISASNYKSKKEFAIDSLYTPTLDEITGHVRHLSMEGIKLVMGEIDNCVGYCLKYSATTTDEKQEEDDALCGDDDAKNEEGKDHRQARKKKNRTKKNPNLATLASEITTYFDMFQPEEEENEEKINKGKTATNNVAASSSKTKMDECIMETTTTTTTTKRPIRREDVLYDMLSKKRDPALLPMITIKCHPNILDREELTRGLSEDLSNEHDRHGQQQQQQASNTKSSSTILLKSTSPLVQQGNLITEILSQCISNDPNGEVFALELSRQRKRQKSCGVGGVGGGVLVRSIWDWTESLVEWAGFTEGFDSITVILEDPEKIPSPTLDSFFATLSSLRSNCGVPIRIVAIDATPGGLGDRMSKLRDPALRGVAGVAARELFVPPPEVQLDMFVNRLFSGKCIPTFLWTNGRLLTRVQEIFQECDNSIVSVAKQLKTDLRRCFAVPGAIASMLHCEKFIVPNESRITWLFGEEHCLNIMSAHSASDTPLTKKEEEPKDDGHIFDLFWKMQTSYLCHQFCQRINDIFNISALGKIGQASGSEFHMRSRMRDLLLLLGNARTRVATWEESSGIDAASSTRPASLRTKLNEFVILVGTFASEEESNASTARALVESIVGWAGEHLSIQQFTLEETPTVQPRRDVAKSLCFPAAQDAALASRSLAHARSVAFRVFRSRVMTLADWHERYFDAVNDEDRNGFGAVDGVSCNEAAFFFAVCELVHCGFVKKLTAGRRKEEAYEKVAIVWGSGR